MKAEGKHWLSPQFLAPNILEVDVAMDAVAPAMSLVNEVRHIDGTNKTIALASGQTLNVKSMSSVWQSDILWISQDDIPTYEFFRTIFFSCGVAGAVAERISFKNELRLYSGFFVTRSTCSRPDFHFDWLNCNNDAFTVLMPLTPNCSDMGLIYKNARGGLSDYRYQMGKAVIFGDHFCHSTAPGQTSERCVLLSFTFGTDRMDNWPKIAETATAQGQMHCRPDGVFVRDNVVLEAARGQPTAPIAR